MYREDALGGEEGRGQEGYDLERIWERLDWLGTWIRIFSPTTYHVRFAYKVQRFSHSNAIFLESQACQRSYSISGADIGNVKTRMRLAMQGTPGT